MTTTQAFLSNVGVNTHWGNTGGPSSNVGNIVADMKTLGVTAIRDRAPPLLTDPGAAAANKILSALVAAGLKHYVALINGSTLNGAHIPANPSAQAQAGAAFLKANPSVAMDFEGWNEPHNFPLTYAGLTDTKPNFLASAHLSNDLWGAVRNTPALHACRVLGPSWSPVPAQGGYIVCDLLNAHIYLYCGGAQAGQALPNIQAQISAFAGKPWVVTELGCSDAAVGGTMAVDAPTQARLLLSALAQAFRLGAAFVGLYELYDDVALPIAWGDALGLFDYNRNIKPSGQALANLLHFLSGASTATVDPTKWIEPAGAYLLPLQRDAKTYDVLIWNEPVLWDYVSHTALNITPVPTAFTLPFSASSVTTFDPITGREEMTTGSIETVNVQLMGYPLVVRVAA